jgi:hypothetical protein
MSEMNQALLDYAQDAAEMSPEAFRAQHGDAFFVFMENSMDLEDALAPRSTLVTDGPGEQVLSQLHKFRVAPVDITGAETGKAAVIGRDPTCDVILLHTSVSTQHAVIAADGGQLVLYDKASTNGTFVNEVDAPRLEDGFGIPLAPMARIRFGAFEVSFMDAAKVQAIARQAWATPEPIF